MSEPAHKENWTAREGAVPYSIVAVDRAAGDLRRGFPVLLVAGEALALVRSTEFLEESELAAMAKLPGGSLLLAITASRARALGLDPGPSPVVALALNPDLGPDAVRTFADPGAPSPVAETSHSMPADRCAKAAVQLAKFANLLPAALVKPLEDRPDQATKWTAGRGLLLLTAEDVESHALKEDFNLRRVSDAHVPLDGAPDARIIAFRPASGGTEQIAVLIGEADPALPVLVRLHSQCFTGDLLGSLRCDCGDQLRGAVKMIGKAGGGVLLYLAQEGRGIGLVNKLRAYKLQDQGLDTFAANQALGFDADERHYRVGAEILRQLGFLKVRLLTNNPDKIAALERFGIDVVERVRHHFPPTDHSEGYLQAKSDAAGHLP